MKQALHVAKEALKIGEVPVGCVVVLPDASIIDPELKHDGHSTTTHHTSSTSYDYEVLPSVIVSHGANQVNATRDATRHAEIVAIDRMLTRGRSSDEMKLPSDVIRKSAHGKVPPSYHSPAVESNINSEDIWVNIPKCKDHWKNTFGWGSGRVYCKEVLSQCDLYVTCEPCIMVS